MQRKQVFYLVAILVMVLAMLPLGAAAEPATPNSGAAETVGNPQLPTARDAKLTLVIYMGVSGAATIEQELLTGLPAHTPVAIIQHASLPQQRHAVTTLGALHTTITRDGLASPSVIVVGDVVRGVALASQDAAADAPLARRAV